MHWPKNKRIQETICTQLWILAMAKLSAHLILNARLFRDETEVLTAP